MRLIDADEFINYIQEEIRTSKEQYTKIVLSLIIGIIATQPTAYNPEKVVEELEERSKEYNSGVRLHGKPEEMLTHEAIDIVKRGGVE